MLEAMWPGFGDEFEQQWHAVQRVFAVRKGQGWRSGRAEHLLTGIPTCTACGSPYAGRVPYQGKGSRRYGCRKGCGYVDADELEQRVLAYALGRLARKDVYAKLRRAGEGGDREAAAARAEADRLRERLGEARASAATPEGISYAALAVQERELSRKIEAAEKRADRAGIPPDVRKLAEAGEALPEVWAGMPLAARRDVIRYLVVVTVRPARGGRHAPPVRVPLAERVSIEWRG